MLGLLLLIEEILNKTSIREASWNSLEEKINGSFISCLFKQKVPEAALEIKFNVA